MTTKRRVLPKKARQVVERQNAAPTLQPVTQNQHGIQQLPNQNSSVQQPPESTMVPRPLSLPHQRGWIAQQQGGNQQSIIKSRMGYQNPNSIAQDLRLLQVQPSMSVGDTEQDALSIARAVHGYGGKVLVASSGGHLAGQLSRFDAIHATLELNRRGPIVDHINKRRVENLAREFRANLIVARSRAPARAALAAATACRLPFVTYFHSIYELGTERQARYNSVLTKGDLIIVPSLYLASHVKDHYDVAPRKIVSIPRGVDLQRFNKTRTSLRAVKDLKDRFGLVENRPIAVIAGRLSFWKGQHLFIEAIKQLEQLNLYGLIFSYGDKEKEYARDLLKLIDRWKLGSRIKIIEEPQDMAVVYAMSDVVVSAAVEPEGFTRTIAEAMALGKPCIAPNHGSSPEQIDHHETGWLFQPGDVNSLTQAMREAMILTPEQRSNLSQWASEAAQKSHDIRNVNDREIDLFLELISR